MKSQALEVDRLRVRYRGVLEKGSRARRALDRVNRLYLIRQRAARLRDLGIL